MSNWPNEVPRIRDGETTFSEDSMGVIINSLAERTEWLKDKVDSSDLSSSMRRGFSFYDTGISPLCKKGMLVAWDRGSGLYIPALAVGTGSYREDGSEIPADSANVLGVLIDTDPETTGGTILCYGCTNDPSIVSELVGEFPVTGDYYLSVSEQGRAYNATHGVNPMSAYCFTYLYSTNDKSPTIYIRPYPPAYNGTSEVRSVSVDKDSVLLEATTTSGSVNLKISPSVVESDNLTGRAITGVTRHGFEYSPVVNKLVAGAGIQINDAVDGGTVISANSSLFSETDINLCSMDGVYLSTSSSNEVIYTFPANTNSSLIGNIRAPYIGNSGLTGQISILLAGTGTSSGLSDLSVTVQNTDGESAHRAVPINYTLPSVSTSSSSAVYKLVVDLNQKITSNALVYVKLSANNPATATKVLAISLRLTGVYNG